MGCFVRGGKNGMGCFVRGDKNCMGCFVWGGKSMRDVLSGVSKNGMGCFVPGCFVLHSIILASACSVEQAKSALMRTTKAQTILLYMRSDQCLCYFSKSPSEK